MARNRSPSGRWCSEEGAGRWRCEMMRKGFRKQEIAAWAPASAAFDGGLLGRTEALLPGSGRSRLPGTARLTGGGPGTGEASVLGWVNTVLGSQASASWTSTYHAWGQQSCAVAILPDDRLQPPLETGGSWHLEALDSLHVRCAVLRPLQLSPVNCGWNLCVIRSFFVPSWINRQENDLLGQQATPQSFGKPTPVWN